MRVTNLKYEYKFNLGNYEHELVGMEIALAENESAAEALFKAKEFVKNSRKQPV